MKLSSKQQQQPIVKKKTIINEDLFNELKEAFNLFDSDQTGQINSRELKAAFKAFGFDIKKNDLKKLIKSDLSKDVSDNFDFEEFSNLLITRLENLRETKEYIYKMFKMFDEDEIGKISFKNLKKIANDIGENLSDEELHEIIEEADRDGDGMINFEEFYRVMRRRNDPIDDFDSDEENY